MIPFKPEAAAPDHHPIPAPWADTHFLLPTTPYILRHPILLATLIEAVLTVALDRERSFQFVAVVLLWALGTAFVYTKGEPHATLTALTPRDEELLDDPSDPQAALVKMQIIQNGEITGVDKGVVSLADGAIFFSGHRTAFCLGVQDLRMKTVDPPKNGKLATSAAVMLSLWHGKNDLRITLDPLQDRPQESRFIQIKRDIATMAKQGGETALERVYPPLTLGFTRRFALLKVASYLPVALLIALQIFGPLAAPFQVIAMIVMASLTVLALLGSKMVMVGSPEL